MTPTPFKPRSNESVWTPAQYSPLHLSLSVTRVSRTGVTAIHYPRELFVWLAHTSRSSRSASDEYCIGARVGMAPMLMHGLYGETETPPPTALPPSIRLSQLSKQAQEEAVTRARGDVPRYARSTLRKAQIASQEELQAIKAIMPPALPGSVATRPKLPKVSAPKPLPSDGNRPFPTRTVPPPPPPIPSFISTQSSAPPYWSSRPRSSSTGRSREMHDGLESPAKRCPIVLRVGHGTHAQQSAIGR